MCENCQLVLPYFSLKSKEESTEEYFDTMDEKYDNYYAAHEALKELTNDCKVEFVAGHYPLDYMAKRNSAYKTYDELIKAGQYKEADKVLYGPVKRLELNSFSHYFRCNKCNKIFHLFHWSQSPPACWTEEDILGLDIPVNRSVWGLRKNKYGSWVKTKKHN